MARQALSQYWRLRENGARFPAKKAFRTDPPGTSQGRGQPCHCWIQASCHLSGRSSTDGGARAICRPSRWQAENPARDTTSFTFGGRAVARKEGGDGDRGTDTRRLYACSIPNPPPRKYRRRGPRLHRAQALGPRPQQALLYWAAIPPRASAKRTLSPVLPNRSGSHRPPLGGERATAP